MTRSRMPAASPSQVEASRETSESDIVLGRRLPILGLWTAAAASSAVSPRVSIQR